MKVRDIDNKGDINATDVDLISEVVHLTSLKRSILEVDDLLFSIAGTIGRVAVLPLQLDNYNCNQAIAFIRLKNKVQYLHYIYQFLFSDEVQEEINAGIVQGVQANVSLTTLSKLKVLLPTELILKKSKEQMGDLHKKIETNRIQLNALTKLRDTLLPKLISGEVRV